MRSFHRRLWLLLFALVATTTHLIGTAWAQVNEPSTEPILRIETGQHTAALKRTDTDAANRFAVTASEDKTVRVWSLPGGKLLRILRLPIGDPNDADSGKAYAVAMSPDGETVAAGGWTTRGHHDIFLFDRASGKLKHRFGDLPSTVSHLVYSRDGSRLAASLGGSRGIRVFDAVNGYQPLPSDAQYKGDSYWAQFDRAGRLVTVSFDGFVRLYARGQYEIPTAQFDSKGRKPYSAAFSPDGSRIAVGYAGVADVDVFSGADLKPLFRPDTMGISGLLISVGWSQDGSYLFAGGTWKKDSVRQVRRWRDGGRGPFIDIPLVDQTILEFLGLKNGSMLFTYQRGFGLIGMNGKPTKLQALSSLDLSEIGDRLRITNDGSAVQLRAFDQMRTYRFALSRRVIEIDPPFDAAMISPIEKSEGLIIANWDQSTTPSVNGKAIRLGQTERALSFAIVPGTQHFLLGADFSLRLIDREGKNVWPSVATPGEAWHVNVSGDGRLGIAAYNGGTIRWHRISDGKELLALFMHPDGQRWILWTPQGYYDASLGADELIGWHVNRGRNQAPDFYPVSQFRSRFYRPDVIQRVLQTLDVEKAVREADEAAGRTNTRAVPVSSMLTPVVEINDPKSPVAVERTDLQLGYSVRLPSPDDTLRMEVIVDSAKVAAEDRPLVNSGSVRAGILHVKIPRRDSRVSVIAYNRNGAGEPATVQVKWRGPGTEPKLNLYVLAIGVSNYKDANVRLKFAAKDAADFVALAKAQQGGLYEKVITYSPRGSLQDGDATREAVLDGLDWISRSVTNSNDVAMIFLAGHGIATPDQHYRFLPYDYDATRIPRTTITDSELEDYLTKIGGKKIFFFDTCYSGNVLKGRAPTTQPDIDRFANQLKAAENGIVVFTSSTGNELSQENDSWMNGAFTLAVVEGMRGAAARPQVPVIMISDLQGYVSRRVRDLTNGNQKPMMAMPKTVEDYPISMRLK
jgi:WD40 repeat protein